jgi:hypothetical protein
MQSGLEEPKRQAGRVLLGHGIADADKITWAAVWPEKLRPFRRDPSGLRFDNPSLGEPQFLFKSPSHIYLNLESDSEWAD